MLIFAFTFVLLKLFTRKKIKRMANLEILANHFSAMDGEEVVIIEDDNFRGPQQPNLRNGEAVSPLDTISLTFATPAPKDGDSTTHAEFVILPAIQTEGSQKPRNGAFKDLSGNLDIKCTSSVAPAEMLWEMFKINPAFLADIKTEGDDSSYKTGATVTAYSFDYRASNGSKQEGASVALSSSESDRTMNPRIGYVKLNRPINNMNQVTMKLPLGKTVTVTYRITAIKNNVAING